MIFKDEVTIHCQSGKGGDGCVSFRREKFVPNGGPDGGDGGDGGSVLFRVVPNLNTLANFHEGQKFSAQDGNSGMGRNCFGKKGSDIVLDVPPGTVIYNDSPEGRVLIADLSTPNAVVLILKGGKGGKGNVHFKSASKQSPQYAQKGGESLSATLHLELKLIAHIGLAGFPNAGKSSLIARITNARPKVAHYPFTTLVPNLGILMPENFGDGLIVADIPGLIEGAHEGKGLGLEFLRHIERTRLIFFVLDISDEPEHKFHILRKELELYSPLLAQRPYAVCFNKIDLMPELTTEIQHFQNMLDAEGVPFYMVSAATGFGLGEIKKNLFTLWKTLPEDKPPLLSEAPIDDFTEGIGL